MLVNTTFLSIATNPTITSASSGSYKQIGIILASTGIAFAFASTIKSYISGNLKSAIIRLVVGIVASGLLFSII